MTSIEKSWHDSEHIVAERNLARTTQLGYRDGLAQLLPFVAAEMRMMIDAGLPPKPGLTALVGGEALPQDLAEALVQRVGAVWNLYGPTETTVYSTMHRYLGGKPLVGRPIANTQIYILDPLMRPVALGDAGELHIGGDGLAVGYLNMRD